MGVNVTFLNLKKNLKSENNKESRNKFENYSLHILIHTIYLIIPEKTFNILVHQFLVYFKCVRPYLRNFSYFVFVYVLYFQYTNILIISEILKIIPTFLGRFAHINRLQEINNIQ